MDPEMWLTWLDLCAKKTFNVQVQPQSQTDPNPLHCVLKMQCYDLVVQLSQLLINNNSEQFKRRVIEFQMFSTFGLFGKLQSNQSITAHCTHTHCRQSIVECMQMCASRDFHAKYWWKPWIEWLQSKAMMI